MKNPLSPHKTAHYWHGRLPVAFVFSAPGSFEAANGKPIFDRTGDHLTAALERHLAPALPSIFPSIDRYDYRITNAYSKPLAKALGDTRTEARKVEIRDPANIDRVITELRDCSLVVLCGKRPGWLKEEIHGFKLVLASHISMSGLNKRWPDAVQLETDLDWMSRSGADKTYIRIEQWADDVIRECRRLCEDGTLHTSVKE